ncbi:monovalent cation:proton antiporter family protein [Mesohalobacter halotolerans]|uniref:Potassium transporter KefB n=1 Tax=Mesohalobacter halotolerans TaxID=1883405 RepID=A0A4U5TPS4_9FLAO|nr:monovalent cation:proton antiporter family protein [Mesohalobacter halotolerans]MBS3738482.1 monovalent cation:proton antiporter-2 (CPA2) family protein [Psychroflexus sp.]TKS55996.1 potassium transporter KefB [Mesohalobacter halotolerans]
MHLPLLQDLVVIMGFSIVVVFLLNRLKIPSILGFLFTGVLIGPHALSLVKAVEQVEIISEIGVILLLFVIGMELSIKQLMSIRKTVFIGGSFQVGITLLVASSIAYSLDFPLNEAIFIGFLFSLSSTAIVLKLFQDRNEINTPHGKNALAILIFQDLIVVPMMLLAPIMSGQSDDIGGSILELIIKTSIVIVITIVSARYLVPKLMHIIAKTESKELFLLTTFAICFAVAFLTSEAGLSLALGAFLAGLIISESEYSHQATSSILPFRELFTSLFFISVGMLLNLTYFINNILFVLLLVASVFVVKSMIAGLAVAVLKYPARTVIITGVSLFQVGEFAFILSKVGIEYDLLSPEMNQLFLSVSILSMLLTPFIIILSEKIAFGILKIRFLDKILETKKPETQVIDDEIENHLIIIGFGINGSNLVKAAQYMNIPYLVVELNAETVREQKKNGIPIMYGDATQDHILESLNLTTARALVIAISDPKATKTILSNVRTMSQSIYTIVRTRYVKEIEELHALGADEVIPEEFETSIEIFTRVLHNFLIPQEDIENFINSLRSDNYSLFQKKATFPRAYRLPEIPDFNIISLKVNKDTSKIIRKTIGDLDIRNQYGINILSIKRKEDFINIVKPSEKICRGDVLFVQGKQENIETFSKLIH